MTTGFDPERLLAALPYRPIPRASGMLDGYVPPLWRWPSLGPYNGFTGEERVETWQVSTWLRREGLLRLASQCDLCGDRGRLGLHSEDYSDLERALTLCSGCHMALHRRFRWGDQWFRRLDRLHSIPSWALNLDVSKTDLRGWLERNGNLVTASARLALPVLDSRANRPNPSFEKS